MNRKYFFILLWILVSQQLWGQDFHFSQFYASPLTLNPALTGRFDGNMRFTGIYRTQWSGINTNTYLYQTPSASAEVNFFNNKASLGFLFLNDQTNDKTFNTLLGGLSFSYKVLFEKFQLSIGLQGTYTQTSLDRNKISGGSIQIEPSTNTAINKFDFNAGIFGNYNINEKNILYFGLSSFHLLTPKDNFVSDVAIKNLPLKFIIHSGAELKISSKISTIPGALISYQAKATETNIGNTFSYQVTDDRDYNLYLFAGIWSRINVLRIESLIPKVGIEYKKIRVTASYDYNINQIGNDVSNANNNIPNTFELSMNYILKTNKGKEYEDCFIFNPRF
jgi:type IX secretion system PorP/SprF family membrane protein